MKKILFATCLALTIVTSCESETDKKNRLVIEEKDRIELEQKNPEEAKDENLRLEQMRIEQEKVAEASRIEKEAQVEKERIEQELHDKYIDNSLQTGSTPYAKYFGGNSSCSSYGCSQIKVQTNSSDVLVTIKKNDEVVRHAFIRAGDNYTFSFPNGDYQAFFYYGKGWNPEKAMKNGEIKGGFIAEENFGKDEPQSLSNNVLEYQLILQRDGNFSTRPSNSNEAL